MKLPYYPHPDYPEPFQVNRRKVDDPADNEPGAVRFLAVVLVIAIGLASAYVVGFV